MMWTSNPRMLCVYLLVLASICGTSANAHAQVAGGTISGTVIDGTGRVVTDAKITITNVATGVTREVTTNEEGVYSAPNLLPGTYEAKFSAQDFKTDKRTGIELTVGSSVVLDLTMSIGGLHETVEVQSEVPAVQLTTSDISAVVNSTTVRELPLNGRSWTDLAQLQPGVNAIHTQPDYTVPQAWAEAFAASGFGGIRYRLSHDPAQRELGVVVFGDAGEQSLSVRRTEPVPAGVIEAARQRFGLIVAPTPT